MTFVERRDCLVTMDQAEALVRAAARSGETLDEHGRYILLEAIFSLADSCVTELKSLDGGREWGKAIAELELAQEVVSDALKECEFSKGFAGVVECFQHAVPRPSD